jgi:excisionase family DNA binding protein
MSDYLTLDEASEFLSTPRSTLYRWLREDKLPGHKLGRRWRFLRSELEEIRRGGAAAPTGLDALAKVLSARRGHPVPPTPASVAEHLLWDGADSGATAVHLIPTGTDYAVRYRTSDGLVPLAPLPAAAFDALDREWSRRSRPVRQEAKRRLFLERGEGEQATRLQVRYRRMETFAGARVTLGLLLDDRSRVSIDRIASNPDDAARLRTLCELNQGVVLVSGRSGSGKTTTAYACLVEAARGNDRVLFTLEESIGTFLPGIDQLEVALDDEPAFRAAFEGVMDSDPDVLFVASTLAQPHREALWGLCLSAAEAGHLVFVQLEADSVEDAATRFISALDRPPGDHLAGAVWQELVPHGQGRRARYEFLA